MDTTTDAVGVFARYGSGTSNTLEQRLTTASLMTESFVFCTKSFVYFAIGANVHSVNVSVTDGLLLMIKSAFCSHFMSVYRKNNHFWVLSGTTMTGIFAAENRIETDRYDTYGPTDSCKVLLIYAQIVCLKSEGIVLCRIVRDAGIFVEVQAEHRACRSGP